MAVTKTYTHAVELTKDQWKHFTPSQKKRILREIGHNESWSETKTIREMVSRGGGWTARDLNRLNHKFIEKKVVL
jgi:type 1 glutamine amidotransferase